MTIGRRIRKTREEKGVTLEYIAQRVGVAIQTIYKYENDIVTNIPLDKLKKIAEALGTTPSYLMGWSETEKPNTEKSNGKTVEFMELFTQLTPEQQALIVAQIKGILFDK